MLSYFKLIRKNLVGQGALKKYLLYALGEIALVVIGILIALQVNNWNENRKNNKLEQSYYCKLHEDIKQDAVQMTSLQQQNQERINSSNKLLHLLQQVNLDPVAVIQLVQGSTSKTTYTFKPSTAAFDDLKSSGNLNVIKDTGIKKDLIQYYSDMEGYGDLTRVNSNKAVDLYFDPSQNFVKLGWQNLGFVQKEIDPSLVDIDLLNAELYTGIEFKNELYSDGLFYLATNSRKKMIYGLMAERISAMNAELGRKCN